MSKCLNKWLVIIIILFISFIIVPIIVKLFNINEGFENDLKSSNNTILPKTNTAQQLNVNLKEVYDNTGNIQNNQNALSQKIDSNTTQIISSTDAAAIKAENSSVNAANNITTSIISNIDDKLTLFSTNAINENNKLKDSINKVNEKIDKINFDDLSSKILTYQMDIIKSNNNLMKKIDDNKYEDDAFKTDLRERLKMEKMKKTSDEQN